MILWNSTKIFFFSISTATQHPLQRITLLWTIHIFTAFIHRSSFSEIYYELFRFKWDARQSGSLRFHTFNWWYKREWQKHSLLLPRHKCVVLGVCRQCRVFFVCGQRVLGMRCSQCHFLPHGHQLCVLLAFCQLCIFDCIGQLFILHCMCGNIVLCKWSTIGAVGITSKRKRPRMVFFKQKLFLFSKITRQPFDAKDVNKSSKFVYFHQLWESKVGAYSKKQWMEQPQKQCVLFDNDHQLIHFQLIHFCLNHFQLKKEPKRKSVLLWDLVIIIFIVYLIVFWYIYWFSRSKRRSLIEKKPKNINFYKFTWFLHCRILLFLVLFFVADSIFVLFSTMMEFQHVLVHWQFHDRLSTLAIELKKKKRFKKCLKILQCFFRYLWFLFALVDFSTKTIIFHQLEQ